MNVGSVASNHAPSARVTPLQGHFDGLEVVDNTVQAPGGRLRARTLEEGPRACPCRVFYSHVLVVLYTNGPYGWQPPIHGYCLLAYWAGPAISDVEAGSALGFERNEKASLVP